MSSPTLVVVLVTAFYYCTIPCNVIFTLKADYVPVSICSTVCGSRQANGERCKLRIKNLLCRFKL